MWALIKLPFQLALGIARMGVMLVGFVGGAFAAGLAGAGIAYGVDLAHAVVGGPLAAVMFVIALFIGMVGWFVPATARIYARGSSPDYDREIPTRGEAIWFLLSSWVATAGLGWVWADLLDVVPAWPPMLAFAAIATVAVVVIVITGGRHVADLFVMTVAVIL